MPEEAAGNGAGPKSIFVISTRKHTLFEGGEDMTVLMTMMTTNCADDDDDSGQSVFRTLFHLSPFHGGY